MAQQYVLTDATFYLDTIGTIGKATAVEVPTITPVKEDRKTIDGVGTQKLPTGKIEVGTFKGTLNCFYPEIFSKIVNPYKSVLIKVYGNLMGFTNGSKDGNKKALLTMKCSAAEYKTLCDKKEHDATSYDLTFDPSSVRLIFDGIELLNVDLDNNVYEVMGEDVRAEIVKNLGIR